MEKRSSYTSRKALGVIFDKVVKRTVNFQPDWHAAFDQRITKRFELSQDMLDTARSIKTQYEICVRRVLAQHDVGTEFELYITWAMTTPETENQYKRQENLGREYDILKARFREQCHEASGGDSDKLEKLVAAMYVVTETETTLWLAEDRRGSTSDGEDGMPAKQPEAKSMPLISFPWIFPGILIQIATGTKPEPRKTRLTDAWHAQLRIAAFAGRGSPGLGAIGDEGNSVSPASSQAGLASPATTVTRDTETVDLVKSFESDYRGDEDDEEAVSQGSGDERHDDHVERAPPDEAEGESALDRLAALMGFN